jgi:hypothetical protein
MKQGYMVKGSKKGRALNVYEKTDDIGVESIRVMVSQDNYDNLGSKHIYQKEFESHMVNDKERVFLMSSTELSNFITEITHLLGREGDLEELVVEKIKKEV